MNNRKTSLLGGLIILSVLFSSCATIIGGANYYAKVHVPNHPDAIIEYNNKYEGTGEALFKALRKNADNFSVTVKKEGCETQTITFSQKKFRGWAFTGSLIFGTLIIPQMPIPLPIGVAVDGLTGAWWKPDIWEYGVTKQDYNNYLYRLDYTGCDLKKDVINESTIFISKTDRLRDIKKLLDEEILTKEEFDIEKSKILNE